MHLFASVPRGLLVAVIVLSVTGCSEKKSGETDKARTTITTPAPSATPPAKPPPAIEDFSGVYVSNFGATVTFTQNGTSVASTSARHGTITCTAQSTKLDCGWVNGAKSGKEVLVKQPDGTLKGTYGDGDSSTGGSISFKKKEATRAAEGSGSANAESTKNTSRGRARACPFADQTKCPTGCEQLQISMGNCGRCGNICPSSTHCDKGVCTKW